ncbi:MAG: hypothetical protein V4692_13810 [Bdellovibrionota bacterium]
MKTRISTTPLSTLLKTILLTATLAALTACGSSVKPRDGEAGALGAVGGSGGTTTECSSFDSNNAQRVTGKSTTYFSNGVHQQDKLRLRITSIPAIFDTSNAVHVKFFRWSANGAGTTNLDSTPVSFVIEKGTTSTTPISSAMTEIDKDDVAALRASAGVSATNSQAFFSNSIFVVSGVDYSWQVLKVVVYNGTAVISEANFLLPAFNSNPNEYAATHPSVLNSVHPFWNIRGDAVDNSVWASRASAMCF